MLPLLALKAATGEYNDYGEDIYGYESLEMTTVEPSELEKALSTLKERANAIFKGVEERVQERNIDDGEIEELAQRLPLVSIEVEKLKDQFEQIISIIDDIEVYIGMFAKSGSESETEITTLSDEDNYEPFYEVPESLIEDVNAIATELTKTASHKKSAVQAFKELFPLATMALVLLATYMARSSSNNGNGMASEPVDNLSPLIRWVGGQELGAAAVKRLHLQTAKVCVNA
jgi:hypothetical protein